MATSGAYKNSAYTFNFSFTKASDPTAFFTGTFLTSEVKVVTRDGGTTNAATNIASAPSHEGNGVYEINLTGSEMNHDEIMIVLVPSSADVVPESISIVTEPTPSDILEVQQTAVSGVADFRASGFSTFNPAVDQVTVATNNDKTGYTLTQTFPTNFADLAITATTGKVTVGTNDDKTGYSISGTLTTLDALDTQQDAQHSTTQSALTTVDTEVGQIKAKTDQLTFTVANQVDANALTGGGGDATAANQTSIINHLTDVKGTGFAKDTHSLTDITADVTGINGAAMRGTDGAYTGTPPTEAQIYAEFATGTNPNPFKADVSGLSTFNAATDTVSVGDKTGFALSSAANDAIGAAFLAYTLTKGSPGTIERAFWQALKTQALTDGEVSGSPTASEFDTNLTAVTGAYDHLLLMFTSGSLEGEARPISTYNNTNGRVVLQDPLTAAPSASDEFIIVPDHTTPDNEIADAILSRNVSNVEVGLGEHTLGTIVLCILESVRSGTTWTIKRSDSTTTHVTKTLTLDASAEPVIGVD